MGFAKDSRNVKVHRTKSPYNKLKSHENLNGKIPLFKKSLSVDKRQGKEITNRRLSLPKTNVIFKGCKATDVKKVRKKNLTLRNSKTKLQSSNNSTPNSKKSELTVKKPFKISTVPGVANRF
mmetsp:Transcript_40792/g.46766  ORF Transcript_40792/g.46766 Transcript_40792/m.46766 type:complete len:122 (+) Transcript_40792:374-739(+)